MQIEMSLKHMDANSAKMKWTQSIETFSTFTRYASQHIWCLSQTRINWEGCARKGISRKNGGMAEVGTPISQDGVAVHLDCWCICLCYVNFAPENPEDGKQRYDIWVSPRGRPHMPTQAGHGEKTSDGRFGKKENDSIRFDSVP